MFPFMWAGTSARIFTWLSDWVGRRDLTEGAGVSEGGNTTTETGDYPGRDVQEFAVAFSTSQYVQQSEGDVEPYIDVDLLGVAFFIDPASSGDVVSLHDPGPAGGRTWFVETDTGGADVRFCINDAADNLIIVGTTGAPMTVSGEVWYFVVIVYDGQETGISRVRIFVNGTEQSVSFIAGSVVPTSIRDNPDALFRVGASADGSAGQTGRIGQLAMLNRGLTGPELSDWNSNGIDFESNAVIAGYKWAGQPAAPNAPSVLTAQLYNNGPDVQLDWSDNSTNETAFAIERKTTGAFSEIDTVAADVTQYIDTSTVSGTNYTYRVKARNAQGDSAPSNEVTIFAQVVAAPNPPSGVIASAASTSSILLEWTDNSSNETGFEIQRRQRFFGDAWSSYATVHTTGVNVTSWLDTSKGGNLQYQYRVRALGSGSPSSYVESNLGCVLPPTTAPTGLSVAPVLFFDEKMDLSWNEVIGCGSYIIYRDGVQVAQVAPNPRTFQDTGLSGGTTYCYKVAAANVCGVPGPQSAQDCDTTYLSAPSNPPTFSMQVIGDGEIRFTFSGPSGASEWVIERSLTDPLIGTPDLTQAGITASPYNLTGLPADTGAYYTMRGKNASGTGPAATPQFATTWPVSPKSFTATHNDSRCPDPTIDLSWNHGGRTAEAMVLEQQVGGSWSFLANIAAGATSYQHLAFQFTHPDAYRIRYASEAAWSTTSYVNECGL